MSKNKTRTKDKYRVVYNDTQRIELENEFRLNEYIAIPRKQELAQKLQLSDRQIKIWFQNRRAKKRKQDKRRARCDMEPHASSTDVSITCQTKNSPPVLAKGSGLVSPSDHQHHLQAAAAAAAAAADINYPEPSMMAIHDKRHQHQQHHHHHHHHQHQPPLQHLYQQQQARQEQTHCVTAQSNSSNNSYYDSSSYQEHSHQDYYSMIANNSHQAAGLDAFQQRGPQPVGFSRTHQANSNAATTSVAASCWPPNLSQSTSPQIATSPAIPNQQFYLETHQNHQPNLPPAPVSPYHANHVSSAPTYMNGYSHPPPPAPAMPPYQHQQHQHQAHYIY